jgi:hypothetical protein
VYTGKRKLTLDPQEIYDRGGQIHVALRGVIDEAERTKARTVDIIPGKGGGQLKKRVLRFLDQPEIVAPCRGMSAWFGPASE